MSTAQNGRMEPGFATALFTGGLAAFLVALGSVADVVLGAMTGGDVAALPHDAAGRIALLIDSPWRGLYGLDLLNLLTTLLLVPTSYASWLLLRHRSGVAGLAFALGLVATAAFVAVNPALPFWGLAREYAAAGPDQRVLLLAAGEAILARGAHGGPGALPAFLLSAFANLLLSGSMLRSGLFGRPTALCGMGGSLLLGFYLFAVTFLPGVASFALAAAAPGGILAIAWLVLTGRRLLSFARGRTRILA